MGLKLRNNVTGFSIDVFIAALDVLPFKIEPEFFPFINDRGERNGTYNDLINKLSGIKNLGYEVVVGDVRSREHGWEQMGQALPIGSLLSKPISKAILSLWERETMGVIERCDVFDMHNELVPYAKAWTWQKSIVEERKKLVDKNEDFCDSAIVLQHPSVYTLGTGSSEDHLKGIKNFYRTDRGGEVTYHGPGQLIMYHILNLRYHTMDLHCYLRALKEVVIRHLSSCFT
ncbi:hypothetical protein AgCh_028165 [Apium graveolens]